MLKSEFEERVSMSVTTEEYWHINEVYNNSDLDKDEFCKLWVKMNLTRVNKAKAAAKARSEHEALQDKAWNILAKYYGGDYSPASKVLTKREIAFCKSIGITIDDLDNSCRSTLFYEVKWQLRNFCKSA